MKKIGILIGLCCSIGLTNAQVNTSYGTGAGTGGTASTFLGYYSGKNTTTGSYNVGVGYYSLYRNTTGYNNIGIGRLSLYNNKTGSDNVGIGAYSLYANTNGSRNVALGNSALNQNTGGTNNTAVGHFALSLNKSSNNVAMGYYAMKNSTTGYSNTALGGNTLEVNTTGYKNTVVGYQGLNKNTTGYFNTAIGVESLNKNTTGTSNTSTGFRAMAGNTTGSYNVANGIKALYDNTTGKDNTASGWEASVRNTTGSQNTAFGFRALRYNTTGNFNVGLGYNATTNSGGNYSYSTAIGAYATTTASSQVRVGPSWITSIGGYQNWTNLSDGRFKKEVQEDVLGLDFIKALRPVSYYVDNEAVNEFLGVELEKEAINNKKQYQTGFIAQEVEATAKELGFEHFGGVDAPANEKSHYGLRYAEFVVPLVKSVQELNTQNEAQTTLIEAQTAAIENLKELVEQQQVQINDLLEAKNTTLGATTISTPSQAKLHQNIPNPFTNETQINLFVPQEVGQALIQVCTIDGKQLFVKEVEGRNETSIMIEGNNLAAGIYMYTLIVDHEIITSKRMVLTK